jgi:hypothetical protein
MKLVMTLLVRDEEDVVAENIEYHRARGVDFFIVTDNLSRDGTPAILERYRRAGLVHVIVETGDDYAQHRWVTRMARMARTDFGADWVINNDADEFWWPEAHTDLKVLLGEMPEGVDAIRAPRYNFVPRPAREGMDFAQAMTIREVVSLNPLGAPLPSKVCHRAYADIEVKQGNHAVRRGGRDIPAHPAPLDILHYPLRSYRQFENKIALGGAAYERNSELPKSTGRTWRVLYEKLQRGELATWYAAQELDNAAVERGLAEGRLVSDGRLAEFFQRRVTTTHQSDFREETA